MTCVFSSSTHLFALLEELCVCFLLKIKMDSAKSVHYKFKIDLAQKMREVIADVVRVTILLFLLLIIFYRSIDQELFNFKLTVIVC